MTNHNPQTIPDRVPSNLLDNYQEHFAKEFANHIAHEDFRERVKAIFTDCIETVTFMEKVKRYAGQAIEEKLFRNMTFWGGIVGTAIITAILTAISGKYIH